MEDKLITLQPSVLRARL